MSSIDTIHHLLESKYLAELSVSTLGKFEAYTQGATLSTKDWGRDKTVQLFQFLIAHRHRNSLHKEQIIDRIWENMGTEGDFKVALHGINKAIEPNKKSREPAKFILREKLTYRLDLDKIWVDVEIFDKLIEIGHQFVNTDSSITELAYSSSLKLYKGIFLPSRIYEDWSSSERERLQVLALDTYASLAEMLLDKNPSESIRLAEQALQFNDIYEDAYRVLIKAYALKGNRPMAIRAFEKCKKALEVAYGIEPLPLTIQTIQNIKNIK